MGDLGAILGASWAVLSRRNAEKKHMPTSFKNRRKINDLGLFGPLHRAEGKLGEDALRSLSDGETSMLLYADDTLLVGKHETHLQHVLDAIAEAGAEIGMELHWNKFQLLQTGCDISLRDPNGNIIQANGKMQYLGASIYSDGKLKHELSKRLGAAWGEFQRYARAWKHTAVSTRRKLQLFGALITSKVMYSLNSAWLNKQERRRLDGFQARCLRHIFNIPHSYISRISNKTVLEKAGVQPYSSQLLKHQLVWFGKIGRANGEDVLRRLTFQPDSVKPVTDLYARAPGRPRHEWAKCLYNKIRNCFCSQSALMDCLTDETSWSEFVTHFALYSVGE